MTRITKKIHSSITKEVVNHDGEFVSSETILTKKVESEPEFVKLYLKDLLHIKDIPKGMNGVLLALLKRMRYDNRVYITQLDRKEITAELGVVEITVRKAIDEFCLKNILQKIETSVYIFNPQYVGRGKWEDIKRIEFKANYESKEGRILDIQIIKNE
jgi:hypothetical protein